MKFIYSIIFTLIITIPLFSQIDSTAKIDLTKIKTFQLDNIKRIPPHLENLYKNEPTLKNDLYANTDKFEIIPLPHATNENSKFELLPLAKSKDFVVRLLKKKEK